MLAASCLALFFAAQWAAARELIRGPYLVDATSGTITACWRLKGGENDCRTVSDLRSGATVSYTVPGIAGSWTGRTLPDSGPLRFAAFGDSGKASRAQHRVARVLERLDPHLTLLLGDIVYPTGDDQDYDEKYFTPYRNVMSKMAFFPALGNHDYANDSDSDDGEDQYRRAYSMIFRRPKYYSFDAGPAHFVSLDVNEAYGIGAAAPIRKGSPQWDWLEGDLKRSSARWKFVFLHIPLYSSYSHGDHELLQRSLQPTFEKHGVDVVFAGHNHIYERTSPIGGVVYMTVGTGGAGLRVVLPEKPPWLAARVRRHGLALMTVEARRLLIEMHDDRGVVQDSVVLIKPASP